MARKTANEIITALRGYIGENIPDGYENLLEDITDSVAELDPAAYVSASQYNDIVNKNASLQDELETVRKEKDSFRERYINRFYNGYDNENNKGYIMGVAPQSEIETKEEWGDYANLFE